MKHLFGYGNLLLSTHAGLTEFFGAEQKITLKPEYTEFLNLNREIVRVLHGYRLYLEVIVYNTEDTDWENWHTLLTQINTGFVTLSPFFQEDESALCFSDCYLENEIQPVSLADIKVGQTLKLKFVKKDLLTSLPIISY